MKTIAITTPKLRNPFVALAMRRHAGRHRPSGHAVRRKSAMQLRRELQQIALHQHSP